MVGVVGADGQSSDRLSSHGWLIFTLFLFCYDARRARHKDWVARSNRRRQKSKNKTKPNQANSKALIEGGGKLGRREHKREREREIQQRRTVDKPELRRCAAPLELLVYLTTSKYCTCCSNRD